MVEYRGRFVVRSMKETHEAVKMGTIKWSSMIQFAHVGDPYNRVGTVVNRNKRESVNRGVLVFKTEGGAYII